MNRSWKLTVAGLTLAGTCAVVAPAIAGAAPVDPAGRLERVCNRVPDLTTRVGGAIDRLEGDASTRGSLAWLRAQLDRARDAGRTQMVTVLENRLAVREARLALLQARQVALADLARICADRSGDGASPT